MERATFEIQPQPTEYRNWRDQLIKEAVADINLLRGDKFKPETAKVLAKRINLNPFLAKSDGELELVLKECRRKRNYSGLYYLLK